jgi:hypothetical protein
MALQMHHGTLSKYVKHSFPPMATCLALTTKFLYVCNIMADISISNKDWPRVKIKLQRKYNHLTDAQLQYTEGQEENLISNLESLVNRNRAYVVFTLKKALVNIDNNRL